MKSLTYRCIKCDGRITVERLWDKLPKPVPKLRCPFCGKACVPEQLHEQMRDERGHFDWEKAFQWSNCPSAYQCELFDLYDASCEAGQIMPKCLSVIRTNLEWLANPPPKPAKPARSGAVKTRAQGKPGQKKES